MRILAAAFAGAMLFASAAQAQDCSLDQLASLPITTLPNGAIAARFKVDDHSVLLAIALQSPHSGLTDGGSNAHAIMAGAVTFDDETLAATADAPAGTAGVLGMDMLRRFNVELDMRGGKLVLFAHPQCAGAGVVYWTNQYTVVPMHIDADGHVIAQLTLDGRPANVEISTGPGHLAMRTPGAVKTIGIGAIALNNPQVEASNDIAPGADARVGLDALKNLHLFFAFGENKLYATP